MLNVVAWWYHTITRYTETMKVGCCREKVDKSKWIERESNIYGNMEIKYQLGQCISIIIKMWILCLLQKGERCGTGRGDRYA
jgi:hypothetical protein